MITNDWKTISTKDYVSEQVSTVERAEFGRSTVDVFPSSDHAGMWKYVVDGKVWALAEDRAEAMREGEVAAWDSEANTLYGRHLRP